MIRVILESPYQGDIAGNTTYARRCVRDSLHRGESPIASHLLYTQPGILLDNVPEERALGIDAGLAWRDVANMQVFYTDKGWSPGMVQALLQVLQERRDFELRALDGGIIYPQGVDKELISILAAHAEPRRVTGIVIQ